MKIVHIAGAKTVKPAAPSKSKKELISARRWMAIQEEANYRKALVKYAERIKAIQLRDPNWKPMKSLP
jgi:hypothetical protein